MRRSAGDLKSKYENICWMNIYINENESFKAKKMKLLFFSLKRAMNFQSLQELCGSSILEIN